jgi:PAS domain S-box-containing protein
MAAMTLHVERVSLWQFDAARSAIICAGLFKLTEGEFESGARLGRDVAPAYFAAIEKERVIGARDARTDPRTREFKEPYLEPLNIFAMLDVPLRRGNEVIGVLCAEHVGETRAWTVDEKNFAVSTANLIAVAIADERRREALAKVAESDARSRLILDTAHDAFIVMDADGRIVFWNAQAERTFGWTREEATGGILADTIIPSEFREAHNNGMRRCIARATQSHSRSPSRRRCDETMGISSGRFCATSRIASSETRRCVMPRTLRKRRRGRKASSSPT